MTTYDDNIKKLSRLLVNAGKIEYTPERIDAEVKKIQQEEKLPTKTQALAGFKSKIEVKRAINLGEQVDAKFDVLSVSIREMDSKKEIGTKIKVQEITIAIERNKKPEIRVCTVWDGVIPIDADNAYQAKINITKGNRVNLPLDGVYTKLEKLIFTPDVLLTYSDPVENAKESTVGVWNGCIGEKFDKNDKMYVEVSSEGSFLPAKVWINDPEMYNDLQKYDNIVFGGYYGKSGINASFIIRAEQKETVEAQKLGKL